MPLADAPTIAYYDASCMVATWRSFVMPVMGHATLTVPSAKAQVRAIETHGKMVGKRKLVEITLLDPELPLPDAETRAALEGAVPIVSPYYAAVSAVFEGSGFRAAFVRGILTSFQIIGRSEYPQRVFAKVDEAAKWSLPHAQAVGMAVADEDEILEAVTQVRTMATQRGILRPVGTPILAV